MKPEPCPRTEQLSALIDEELQARPREEIESHAAICPVCGSMLRELTELRLALRPLGEARPGVDLAPLISPRLAPRATPRPAKSDKPWWNVWQLLPSGLAAAGTLTAGVYLGAVLGGGATVSATPLAAMAVFDPIPPGGICVGLQSCYSPGK
ncbi:MAG: zf-HC2 domain-containing protein [Betaproteobacteria bacterium]|nr:zf-HC2 domain-containing protein [Betaproteobacteria bacterium]